MKNKKLVLIGTILVVMTGLLYLGQLNSASTISSNMLKLSKGVEQLRQTVNFSFNVPKVLLDEKNLIFNSVGGQLAEIDSNTIKFKAAKLINDNADVTGNYSKYKIDNQYDISGNTVIKSLRIRTNSDKLSSMDKAVVNYTTGNIVYSLEINRHCTYTDILDMLELTDGQIKPKSIEKATVANTVNSPSSGTITSGSDVSYDVYQIPSLGCTIRLPKTLSTIKTVEGNSGFKYVAFLISGKVILDIEENNYIKYNTDTSKYESLKGGYTLKYFKTNPFDNNTADHNSYEDITHSMTFIVNSFKPIDNNK